MILLKKEVNEIFETHKLPELTVDIQNGFLQIVGRKCGQPMMMINGISPSKKMTKDERKIIIDDYLLPVIVKHKADFDKVITLKRAGKVLEEYKQIELDIINKLPNLRVQLQSNYDYTLQYSLIKMHCYIDLPDNNGIGSFTETTLAIKECELATFTKVQKLISKYSTKISPLIAIVKDINKNTIDALDAQKNLATVCGW